MNGRCPACRRTYDENNIEWKSISPEEIASYKADQAQQAKKKAAARQKEVQRREADSMSRRHLSGLRVVQKNLVYVTGMCPYVQDDEAIMNALYEDKYFAQYGPILKIVVSKGKITANHQQSIGVYITFMNKEDAAKCIAAVDGADNMGRTLRAQYGTTKYCSAYIRGETCNNRKCMFLHEPGEDSESFTRQDLSSRNALAAQPSQAQLNSGQLPSAPPQQAPQAVAAATQSMKRQESKDSASGSADLSWNGPALPSTASWGNKGSHGQQVRRASRTTAGSSNSRRGSSSAPAPPSTDSIKVELATQPLEEEAREQSTPQECWIPGVPRGPSVPHLDRLVEKVLNMRHSKSVDLSRFSLEEQEQIKRIPCFIDPEGGLKRRRRIEREEALRRKQADEMPVAAPGSVTDENHESGSLQLGGEPEDRTGALGQAQHAIQPPQGMNFGNMGLGSNLPLSEDLANLNLNGRGLGSQQQQQYLLQQLKNGNQQPNMLNTFPSSQVGILQSSSGNAPGHSRQTSRFSFANDSASASASVKPVANAKLMNQQAAMMPQGQSLYNPVTQTQSLGGQFFSGVQGPPPGLKPTSTPPVNGLNMFGQGQGFAASGLNFGAGGVPRNVNDELTRNAIRRNDTTGGQMPEASKREYLFPSFLNHHHPPSSTASSSPAPGLLGNFSYGGSGHAPPGSGGAGAGGLFSGTHQEHGGSSQKQKKKGKKHRHANTSSSGGGTGVVDVSEQNLLQARLQQQSGASMMAQGLYSQNHGGFASTIYNGGFPRW
jgi:CCR4-NOT transcription complex subunit 4